VRPPRGFDPTARAAFRDAVRVLEAIGEDPRLSAATIAAYARAVSTAARLRREWHAGGASGFLIGPRGGVYPNPLLHEIERAERQSAELADALGLTPLARRRLGRHVGRPTGAASAKDRANVVSLPRRLERPTRPA
jgi:phage terminase small subunit